MRATNMQSERSQTTLMLESMLASQGNYSKPDKGNDSLHARRCVSRGVEFQNAYNYLNLIFSRN